MPAGKKTRKSLAMAASVWSAKANSSPADRDNWVSRPQVDDNLLQHDAGIHHPELERMIARPCQGEAGLDLTHTIFHRRFPVREEWRARASTIWGVLSSKDTAYRRLRPGTKFSVGPGLSQPQLFLSGTNTSDIQGRESSAAALRSSP